MSVLTENIVLSRTRAQDLNSVRKLNCWGSELTDVSLVRRMPYVEVLSLSVNSISTLLDFSFCKNLQELYIRKNSICDLNEVIYLQDLPRLKSLWLADNPCAECDHYRMTVLRTLPNLQKLDNINVAPTEVEQACVKGRPLVRPCDSNKESPEEELNYHHSPTQIVTVHPQATHIIPPAEKVDSSKVVDEKQNHNEALITTHPVQRTESCSEIAVPKPIKSAPIVAPKPEPVHPEPRESVSIPAQPRPPQANSKPLETVVRHSTSSSSVVEHHEHHNNVSNVTQAHHNHAFYARVQTLVDHSSRKPRKPSDLRCESRSTKSATSSPPPHPPPASTNNNIDESSPENYQTSDIDPQYYTGSSGRDFAELETRSCSLDSEASFYADQRGALGSSAGNNSRSDKNSPNRILPKGGRNRNSNILSAVLCLIKELDYASLEVVETAIHCQMEDMD